MFYGTQQAARLEPCNFGTNAVSGLIMMVNTGAG
jgi:hypothetical protein